MSNPGHLAQTIEDNGSPAQAGDAVIEVRDVRYAIGGRAIFDGLDITARRGRITAFMGPSGTGKTTLLRLITGQSHAERGSVRVFGDEVATHVQQASCSPCAGAWACCSRTARCSPISTCTKTSHFRCARTPTCPSRWYASWC